MQYTQYFSGVIRNHGSLNFSSDQLKLIMNLIHLEGKLEGVKSIQSRFKDMDPPNRYDLMINSIDDQIKNLTMDLLPGDLMKKWQLESN